MKRASSSADIGLYSFEATILTQLNLCVSLMTACIPCLKPFLDAFDSGMLKVSMLKRATGNNSNSYGNSYALGSMGRGVKESVTRSRYLEDEQVLGTAAAAFAVTAPGRPLENNSLRIHRTDEWTVQSENGKTPSVDENEASSNGSGSRYGHHAL
ncbi:hypothetical protein N7510_002135 [Penicillium lagena]|uniref:uncharacterized protein n=1 Tax=Penicillium lagena TaxID=94218 RepID=UPI0025417486|nr:uncharacterized protein N7510_002135 [Penicillium lagena]KAJ5625826.1 hypothetical protein N7510_002135 [Penicillium lagena]